MRGRLLESWLDKANERGYQPVLCQALAERGHTVLHSTRHGPMEFGKDIISRDQAGNVYAFQLKGNPGARLGIGQFNREILPQMYALMQLPVEPPLTEHPVLPRPCLVTNGEVDEEVHAAIRALNGRAKAEKRPELQLITRGQLLGDYLLPVAERMWPTSTEFDAKLLSCWAVEGRDYFDANLFSQMLRSLLPFDEPPRSPGTMERSLLGAAIANEICLRRYVEADNHVAVLFGRALFQSAGYSLLHKAGLQSKECPQVRALSWRALGDGLIALLLELRDKKERHYYDSDARLEFIYHSQRLLLLWSIIALMQLVRERQPEVFGANLTVVDEANSFTREFIDKGITAGCLLGEYAVPQLLLTYWYLANYTGLGSTDYLISSCLEALLGQNSSPIQQVHIPNPYHRFPEVVDEMLTQLLGDERRPDRQRSFKFQLWTAMPLFGVLVRRNLKRTAQCLFPELTRFLHRSTFVRDTWEYGLYESESAIEDGERLVFPAKWHDYIERTRAKDSHMPAGLAEDLLVLGLFLIIAPHRLTEATTYHLDEMLVGSWHR